MRKIYPYGVEKSCIAGRSNLMLKGKEMTKIKVEPQPSWIASSGRWCWRLPKHACFPGCCTEVVTASREWWEYAPKEAKPDPKAKAIIENNVWYWIFDDNSKE